MKLLQSLVGVRHDLASVRDLARLAREQQETIKQQGRELAEIRSQLKELLDEQRDERKWRQRFSRNVNSLLRAAYLDLADDVTAGRFQICSQNEEDGIVLALLGASGAPLRTFVDIGCGRKGGNSGLLAELGWAGLMVDASEKAIEQLRQTLVGYPRVTVLCRKVSPSTVNDLVAQVEGPDFFSLDIDSIDYWVLEAMTARPRVLCVEYNWLFGAERAVTVPRDTDFSAAPKGYHGASLAAFDKLLSDRGYRLVCCDPSGTNAFFVRNDLAPEVPARPVEQAWRPGRSGHPAGLKGLSLVEV